MKNKKNRKPSVYFKVVHEIRFASAYYGEMARKEWFLGDPLGLIVDRINHVLWLLHNGNIGMLYMSDERIEELYNKFKTLEKEFESDYLEFYSLEA